MKVAFDYRAFTRQKYGGVSRYFVQLTEHLSLLEDTEVNVIAPVHINMHVQNAEEEISSGRCLGGLPRPMGRLLNPYNAIAFRRALQCFRPDVYHQTYYSSPTTAKRSGQCRVVTVYDMIHERFPENFGSLDKTAEQKLSAISRADHIICISESTRRDLVDLTDTPLDKTSVVYLGVESPVPLDARPDLVDGPFLLYVGERRGYKNFDALLRAFASSTVLAGNVKLVCFGGGGFSRQEISRFVDLGLPERAVLSVRGDDAFLASLYSNAHALVFPSLYEGFGLPLVEAMSYGCPVICGRHSGSVGEVVGDAACLFDPTDIDSLRDTIESVLGDDALTAVCRDRGRARAKSFAWDACARNTRQVYAACVA